MNLGTTKLNFVLPENPFGSLPRELDTLTKKVKLLEKNAWIGNEKFRSAYSAIYYSILNKQDLADVLDEPIKVRALAILLQSDTDEIVRLTDSVFQKIDQLRPNPSSLLIQNMYQYYLTWYDQLYDPSAVARWLKTAMEKKGTLKGFHKYLLKDTGPQWLAKLCISNNREFSNELFHLNLENYAAGRFLTIAKRIYFVEQLKAVPLNQPHPLLLELQNRDTFESRYDEHLLLGHKALQILIERAPQSGIDDSWLNVILTIAGDPRVPTTHVNYQKWWSALDPSLNTKVKGWLSHLDLRLFLEALKDYSYQPGNGELKRMFASRKYFLEGLLNNNLITDTRLYLSRGAASYIRQNYKAEHLPSYSMVMDGNRSIIHVQMGESHIIEGSHSCYLWIYKKLDPSAIVFDFAKTKVRYSTLTQSLSAQMRYKGTPSLANITHNPTKFYWQHKAIDILNKIGISITAKDVLSDEDYFRYKRFYGIR